MEAEFQAVRFAPKQADVLQARSLGASRLRPLHPYEHSCQAVVSLDRHKDCL